MSDDFIARGALQPGERVRLTVDLGGHARGTEATVIAPERDLGAYAAELSINGYLGAPLPVKAREVERVS